MNNKERLNAVMNFQSVDCLPAIEWAAYWNKTIDRWRGETLPNEFVTDKHIWDYFGLDPFPGLYINLKKETFPAP